MAKWIWFTLLIGVIYFLTYLIGRYEKQKEEENGTDRIDRQF